MWEYQSFAVRDGDMSITRELEQRAVAGWELEQIDVSEWRENTGTIPLTRKAVEWRITMKRRRPKPALTAEEQSQEEEALQTLADWAGN